MGCPNRDTQHTVKPGKAVYLIYEQIVHNNLELLGIENSSVVVALAFPEYPRAFCVPTYPASYPL